ncbi:MAG: hypothetical protein DRH20_06790 [Deltaproteobacteria bacterium]|nr:MAG: hypothetical protein DRH20_06790 [Deltaproteobacteria bacterium]
MQCNFAIFIALVMRSCKTGRVPGDSSAPSILGPDFDSEAASEGVFEPHAGTGTPAGSLEGKRLEKKALMIEVKTGAPPPGP